MITDFTLGDIVVAITTIVGLVGFFYKVKFELERNNQRLTKLENTVEALKKK